MIHTHTCFASGEASSHIKEPTCILNNDYIFKPALHWEGKVIRIFMIIRIIESL